MLIGLVTSAMLKYGGLFLIGGRGVHLHLPRNLPLSTTASAPTP